MLSSQSQSLESCHLMSGPLGLQTPNPISPISKPSTPKPCNPKTPGPETRRATTESLSEPRRFLQDRRNPVVQPNVGTSIIRIGSWGPLYCNYKKNTQNGIGNYSDPYIMPTVPADIFWLATGFLLEAVPWVPSAEGEHIPRRESNRVPQNIFRTIERGPTLATRCRICFEN